MMRWLVIPYLSAILPLIPFTVRADMCAELEISVSRTPAPEESTVEEFNGPVWTRMRSIPRPYEWSQLPLTVTELKGLLVSKNPFLIIPHMSYSLEFNHLDRYFAQGIVPPLVHREAVNSLSEIPTFSAVEITQLEIASTDWCGTGEEERRFLKPSPDETTRLLAFRKIVGPIITRIRQTSMPAGPRPILSWHGPTTRLTVLSNGTVTFYEKGKLAHGKGDLTLLRTFVQAISVSNSEVRLSSSGQQPEVIILCNNTFEIRVPSSIHVSEIDGLASQIRQQVLLKSDIEVTAPSVLPIEIRE